MTIKLSLGLVASGFMLSRASNTSSGFEPTNSGCLLSHGATVTDRRIYQASDLYNSFFTLDVIIVLIIQINLILICISTKPYSL